MQQPNNITVLTHIHQILYELGMKPADPDMFYTAYAILAAYQQPELLHDVSGALYPSVAAHYDTDPEGVESSVEHAICQIYHTHRNALSALFGQAVSGVPHADTFLSAVTAQL